METKTHVEFRIVHTDELPPIVISQNENDECKVVLNTHHRIWLSLNRKIIAGIVEALQDKMDMILSSYLEEQYMFEKEDREIQ